MASGCGIRGAPAGAFGSVTVSVPRRLAPAFAAACRRAARTQRRAHDLYMHQGVAMTERTVQRPAYGHAARAQGIAQHCEDLAAHVERELVTRPEAA